MIFNLGICDISTKECRPIYNRWFKIFERCYSEPYLESRPSYRGCSVASDFHLLSDFKEWIVQHPWEGRSLDKDILKVGNKVYSKSTCLFVPKFINSLFTNSSGGGKYPLGVYFEPINKKFRVQVHKGYGQVKVGDFDCPYKGHMEWVRHKAEAIEIAITRWKAEDPKSFREDAEKSLRGRVEFLLESFENGREVKCLQ